MERRLGAARPTDALDLNLSERSATTISSSAMNTHRALTWDRYLGARLSTVSTPVCGPHDVIVAPRFVGICGTDIQVFRGARSAPANTLGHEGGGAVAEVGALVKEWPGGESAVVNPVIPPHPEQEEAGSLFGLTHRPLPRFS